MVAGSKFGLDIIDTRNGNIIHAFVTDSQRVLHLNLLATSVNKIFILAQEEMKGVYSDAIYSVELV